MFNIIKKLHGKIQHCRMVSRRMLKSPRAVSNLPDLSKFPDFPRHGNAYKPVDRDELIHLHLAGLSNRRIAKQLKITHGTVAARLREWKGKVESIQPPSTPEPVRPPVVVQEVPKPVLAPVVAAKTENVGPEPRDMTLEDLSWRPWVQPGLELVLPTSAKPEPKLEPVKANLDLSSCPEPGWTPEWELRTDLPPRSPKLIQWLVDFFETSVEQRDARIMNDKIRHRNQQQTAPVFIPGMPRKP